jgi:hypothetical protein
MNALYLFMENRVNRKMAFGSFLPSPGLTGASSQKIGKAKQAAAAISRSSPEVRKGVGAGGVCRPAPRYDRAFYGVGGERALKKRSAAS